MIYIGFPIKYKDDVKKCSLNEKVDIYLVLAVIKAESGFNQNTVSDKGAIGLMQILPSTAEYVAEEILDERISDLKNAEVNIRYGVAYLNYLKNKFDDEFTFLAAYNAGEGNVNKWLNDERYAKDGKLIYIPFSETRKYVKKILSYKKIYRFIYPYIS